MGLIVYGHPELDEQIAQYQLGHALVIDSPRACRAPVQALAAPWMDYLQAPYGGVEVHAGPDVPVVSGRLADGGTLARYTVTAIDALAEMLATDPTRTAWYGTRALDGLRLQIRFTEHTPDGQAATDAKIALVSITTPPWTHEQYWGGGSHWLDGESTTISYHVMQAAVQRAWDALAAPS